MSIRVSLRHKTTYTYDRPTTLSPQLIRLRPAAHTRTPIEAYSLKIEPEGHFVNWQQDPFGNHVARVVFPKEVRRFQVEVGLIADTTVINPFDFFVEPEAEKFPFAYAPELRESLRPYLEMREEGPRFKEWMAALDRTGGNLVDFLVRVNQKVLGQVRYTIRMEAGVQTCEETLVKGSGSCRDSAWLLVHTLRRLGIAARFASGYLLQLKPDQKPLEGGAGPIEDFTDLHAWTEAFLPGAGWVGLDPTSGLLAGEGHIPLSCTPSPEDAAPITGSTSDCKTEFGFEMEILRLEGAPRVTAPYTEAEWESLLRAGDRVDESMRASGLGLTQGGEPTFVSIDDRNAAEWNTDALGDRKYAMAQDLLWRLKGKYSPGSLIHYGQGKWYPGEPLPRWALTTYWRRDGRPVWNNDKLQARAPLPGLKPEDAARFTRALARRLGLDDKRSQPAYEDIYHYLLQEGKLPADIDPLKFNLKEQPERRRLFKLLERGLDQITGWILPLRARFDGNRTRWESGPWELRRGRLFLLPGDSPMGFRLPLSSLPVGKDAGFAAQMSPLAERPELPAETHPPRMQAPGSANGRKDPAAAAAPATAAAGDVIRTALCVEARSGFLFVFLPPVPDLESFLDLAAAIEAAAAETALPVRIEGYQPPQDDRLLRYSITPDPGVIEVNIHPASTWRELVSRQEILYEEARQCRLGAEKFMLDGRHTGTGGGNHIVLGAQRPADSPFLKRPDLLRSLVNFWQNHPSLSYLFSGLFIGPTSQSPRADEARDDILSELALAFSQVEGHSRPGTGTPFPWQVDRIFRNLLVDLTGNTHRAEICIDKLHNPESLTGRLGLVELRGFEMPPHPRMGAAQSLLVRALMARFWEKPYAAPLQPWGVSLHDRWMLPHYLWKDFEQVLAIASQAGPRMDPAWFRPFLEFRFPVAGEVQADGIKLELRVAGEPWPVLGEEASGQGTSRYVDSSLERLQVKVSGIANRRHRVHCNGRALPLMDTGVRGEAVAGLRYRAWQPHSALHPLIGVHAPLTFDIVDLWNGASVGGCTYHVAHPAGRNYEAFPVNASEAEARRAARFQAFGHTPGLVACAPPRIHPDHPLTLDLREPV